jgi:hypothetical protein
MLRHGYILMNCFPRYVINIVCCRGYVMSPTLLRSNNMTNGGDKENLAPVSSFSMVMKHVTELRDQVNSNTDRVKRLGAVVHELYQRVDVHLAAHHPNLVRRVEKMRVKQAEFNDVDVDTHEIVKEHMDDVFELMAEQAKMNNELMEKLMSIQTQMRWLKAGGFVATFGMIVFFASVLTEIDSLKRY